MWGKGTIISHGIEISIAGGGEEMVCAYLLGLWFFFSFFFFFFLSSCVHCFRYKKPHVARAMERTKPINPKIQPPALPLQGKKPNPPKL